MSDDPEDDEDEASFDVYMEPEKHGGTDYSDAHACRADVALRAALALQMLTDEDARKLLKALGDRLIQTLPVSPGLKALK